MVLPLALYVVVGYLSSGLHCCAATILTTETSFDQLLRLLSHTWVSVAGSWQEVTFPYQNLCP